MNALILVDIQNDFLPGGALPVPDGDKIVPLANALMAKFDIVVATRDWHPAGHGSFASRYPGRNVGDVAELNGLQQILWPDHCVQDTSGADLAPGLDLETIERVFQKGTDTGVDSYSGFFDNARRNATGLGEYLKDRGVTEVAVCGLATDYCVKFTALDAVDLGFETTLVEDACRGVEISAGDVAKAIEEMKAAGAKVVNSG
jgi:nicotinamidase/pyrazinamidase